jgi:hypothetical protein
VQDAGNLRANPRRPKNRELHYLVGWGRSAGETRHDTGLVTGFKLGKF